MIGFSLDEKRQCHEMFDSTVFCLCENNISDGHVYLNLVFYPVCKLVDIHVTIVLTFIYSYTT